MTKWYDRKYVTRNDKLAVKKVIREFLIAGGTTHSGQGKFVKAVVSYCEEHNIPYQLTGNPKIGYRVIRKENL